MTVLITGGGGQLASDLQSLLGERAVARNRSELDIDDPTAVERVIGEVRPSLIINCAAYHNVGACEQNPELAWRTNVEAVRGMARHGVRLVHISTNYVFDGRREEPYEEDDLPGPRSVYALAKLAGEYAALGYGTQPLVVRTGGLYGQHGSQSKGGNFVQRMIGAARERGALSVVADQRLQPTYTADLAAAVIEAADAGAEGVIHLTSAGACSWHEFTVEILHMAGISVPVEPTTTTMADGIDRPLNGVLARTRTDSLGLTPIRDWRSALEAYMSEAGLHAATTPS